MPAHPGLSLAGRQGTHDRHRVSAPSERKTIRRFESPVNNLSYGCLLREFQERLHSFISRQALSDNGLLRFIQVLLEVGHKGGAAGSDGGGIALV
jgi:hypothetical protein